ncbi:LOW QUALITY PROTEIN: regucalcin-like [Haliotis rubra]|uniref:LOW QUALITY PROTEIN: regucalcin-like n=1 Tax=Haliotis rubra TaxID=36100 RepID=UPI001EE552FF|nr:LOW QUALITY PROTEIN: regucalcin-like [Haliotis rubra]
MSEKIEAVVKNSTRLGEGPHWDDTTQCLYYVDLFVGDVHRYNAVTGDDSRLNLGDTIASIIIPRQKGGFVVSKRTDLAILDSWDRDKVTSIANRVEADANMINDGKVDASGRLWFGSCFCGKDIPDPDNWPKHQGSLYSLDPDGSVKKHISNITISNGMDWNDDNSVMYYIDSIARQVWAFDFDITAGTVSNQRTVADFSSTEIPDMGYPDGMTIDTEGKLWVACFDAGKVVRIDPETGTVIRTVKFPCEKITSCCFGGEDFTDLYVTSAAPAQLGKTPLAGSIFKVTGLGVRGRKANMFAG